MLVEAEPCVTKLLSALLSECPVRVKGLTECEA